jgi:hypothetical protein
VIKSEVQFGRSSSTIVIIEDMMVEEDFPSRGRKHDDRRQDNRGRHAGHMFFGGHLDLPRAALLVFVTKEETRTRSYN